MALTLQQLQTRLDEAQTAYHELMTGQSTVRVQDQNGESITYTVANATRLKTYIADLEAQIEALQCGKPKIKGPLKPNFGFL